MPQGSEFKVALPAGILPVLALLFSEKMQTEVVRARHYHLDWQRLSYREQFKEGDEEADRGNDGNTTSESGLASNGINYYGKLRTARSGGSWL